MSLNFISEIISSSTKMDETSVSIFYITSVTGPPKFVLAPNSVMILAVS